MSCRVSMPRRMVLEAIQSELGHPDLSVTLRLAIDEFIERHLRQDKAA